MQERRLGKRSPDFVALHSASDSFVMPALVAGIHVLLNAMTKDVDGRNKSGMTNMGA
jgi:hypothetical protein